jgi:rare lipoprotein A
MAVKAGQLEARNGLEVSVRAPKPLPQKEESRMRKGSTVLGSLGVISAEIVLLILPFFAAGAGALVAPARTSAAEEKAMPPESATHEGASQEVTPQDEAAQRDALAARKAWLESQSTGLAAPAASRKAKPKTPHMRPVKLINTRATWYGPGFHGHRTASGERFDRNAMTLASRHLPMGTRVRVVNLMTGKSAVARVNDRGPFRGGYTADLSQGLAHKIGMGSSGPVRLEVLSPKDKSK